MKVNNKSATAPNSCAVCQLPSVSTINFGRRSCKACAAFFRRTVAFNNKYKCMSNCSCIVHYEKRMICKKCRFDKCIAVDMNPDLVRSKAAETRRSPSESKTTSPGTSTELGMDSIPNTIQFYVMLESQLNDRRRLMYKSTNVDEIFGEICECPFDRNCIFEIDFKVTPDYRPNIIMMVDYARSYPHFDKLLPKEQSLFHRYCIAVDGTLNSAWYSININSSEQLFVSQYASYMNMDPLPPPLEKCEFSDSLVTQQQRNGYSVMRQSLISHWFAILKPMERLKLNFREFCLFKALACWIICTPHFTSKSRSYCETERKRLMKALMKVCRSPESDGSERMGELLLFMSPVKEELRNIVTDLVLHDVFPVHNIVDPLIADILDYKKFRM